MSFAQDLRASVLQAAMQGKLTEQLATDTPVSELLSDVKAEKERLIAEKKIKKEKPLSAISDDDIPFDIPESWEYIRLGNMSFITSGGTPSRSNPSFWNGDIPWVKIGDMSSKYLDKTEETISQKGLENSSAKYFEKGTILYSIFASIGTVSILNIKATTNQAIAGIMPYGNIDNDYLYHVLVALKDILVKKGRGCAQSNINQEILKNTPIPIPPIEEQKRIVQRIEEIMKHIDELEAIEEELKKLKEVFPADMKASVLQAAMQGKLTEQLETDSSVDDLLEDIKKERERLVVEGKIKKSRTKQNNNFVQFKDEEEPFAIPDNWRWVTLSNIVNIRSASRVHQSDWKTNGIPFYRAREIVSLSKADIINNELFIDEELYKKYADINEVPIAGDLMVSGVGTLGATYIVKQTDRFYYKDASVLCFENRNEISSKFLQFVLQTPYMVSQIYATEAYGTTVATLTMERANKFILALPPLEEQNRIVAKLEQILPLISDLS